MTVVIAFLIFALIFTAIGIAKDNWNFVLLGNIYNVASAILWVLEGKF